jgi:hypothetical protein
MQRIALKTGWVCAVLALSGCIFVHRPLINPEVNIPPNVSQEDVKHFVYQALTDYGWIIETQEPGATTAHLQQDKLFARVRVEYDPTHATVRYLESKNFYHSKSPSGEEQIHSRYLVWARNIAQRLNEELNPTAPASESSRRKEPLN